VLEVESRSARGGVYEVDSAAAEQRLAVAIRIRDVVPISLVLFSAVVDTAAAGVEVF